MTLAFWYGLYLLLNALRLSVCWITCYNCGQDVRPRLGGGGHIRNQWEFNLSLIAALPCSTLVLVE